MLPGELPDLVAGRWNTDKVACTMAGDGDEAMRDGRGRGRRRMVTGRWEEAMSDGRGGACQLGERGGVRGGGVGEWKAEGSGLWWGCGLRIDGLVRLDGLVPAHRA